MLVAAVEAPTAGWPGHRALHDLPMSAQPLGSLASFAGGVMGDAVGGESLWWEGPWGGGEVARSLPRFWLLV